MTTQLLIIDDDIELCELLTTFLNLEGFVCTSVHDGAAAIEQCRREQFNIIVLDVMLPSIQGFEVLRSLREFTDTPVLMLTARGEDTDRIVGLEMGADDYLPKPCNPRELTARLRAILRRVENSRSAPDSRVLSAGDLHIDRGTRSCTYCDTELSLTTAEFNILAVLVNHSGTVVSKETLTEKALNRQLTAYDRSVDVHVSSIRKKLLAAGMETSIMNIRGVGYQLSALEQVTND